MRRLMIISVALLIVGAGCSESGGELGDPTDDPTQSVQPAPSPTAHESVDQAFELALQAPANFELTENDRGVLMAEDHNTYDYQLVDGSQHSRLTVTTYLVPDDVDISDQEAQLAFILEYDDSRGNQISHEKHEPALVHRYQGIRRFASLVSPNDREISQQNFYLFAGQHLIQITCQWEYDFEEVQQGCNELTQAFAYPEEWPLLYRIDS